MLDYAEMVFGLIFSNLLSGSRQRLERLRPAEVCVHAAAEGFDMQTSALALGLWWPPTSRDGTKNLNDQYGAVPGFTEVV